MTLDSKLSCELGDDKIEIVKEDIRCGDLSVEISETGTKKRRKGLVEEIIILVETDSSVELVRRIDRFNKALIGSVHRNGETILVFTARLVYTDK